MTPANDNSPIILRPVPLVGIVGDDGRVTITDPDWLDREKPAYPSDPREA
jgi:hypothetical protein